MDAIGKAVLSPSTSASTSRTWRLKNEPGAGEPYTCSVCGETHPYQEVESQTQPPYSYFREMCKCEREADAKDSKERRRSNIVALVSASGMEGDLTDMNLKHFQPVAGTERAVAAVKEYIKAWPSSRVLIFSGKFGCGKTHLACAIGNRLIDKELVYVRYINLSDYLSLLKDHMRGSEPLPREEPRYAQLMILDELARDDDPLSTFDRQEVYRIVNARYIRRQPMVICTSKTRAELAKYVGGATVDRLTSKDRAEWIEITAGSWRAGHQGSASD